MRKVKERLEIIDDRMPNLDAEYPALVIMQPGETVEEAELRVFGPGGPPPTKLNAPNIYIQGASPASIPKKDLQ